MVQDQRFERSENLMSTSRFDPLPDRQSQGKIGPTWTRRFGELAALVQEAADLPAPDVQSAGHTARAGPQSATGFPYPTGGRFC